MAQPAVTGPEFGWQYTLPVRDGVLKDQAKERHLRPVPDLPPEDEYDVATTLDPFINDSTGNSTFDLKDNTKPVDAAGVAEAPEVPGIPIYDETVNWLRQRAVGGFALTADMVDYVGMDIDMGLSPEVTPRGAEPNLLTVTDVKERTNETNERIFRSTLGLCEQVQALQDAGYDVAFTNPYDRQGLPLEQERAARDYIAELESAAESGEGTRRFLKDHSVQVWNNLKMRAVSLYPLYGASRLQTLGEGIDPGIYELELINQPDGTTVNAMDALRQDMAAAGSPEKAEEVIGHYHEFIDEPISDHSRLIWGGSLDGRGVRTRAYEAIGGVVRHFAGENGMIDRKDLQIASFACGAAGPMNELVELIQDFGGDVDKAHLIDMDPMALATAVSVMKRIGDKLSVHKQNLTRGEVTDYLEPESIDVADLLGLFEYFPDRLATSLLSRVKKAMKPGGLIVFGNMVDDREEVTFFNDVVKWPKLYRRSISKTLEIIEKAGFDLNNVSVRIPAREGVYAVYAIQIPGGEHEADQMSESKHDVRALGALASSNLDSHSL